MKPAIIKLSPDTYLSTKDGIIVTKRQAEEIIKTAVLRQKNVVIDQNVSLVNGRDNLLVDLQLKGLNENIPPSQGFLVKVFLLAQDGSLKRMYQTKIIDPADNNIVRDSYDQYLQLDFDV